MSKTHRTARGDAVDMDMIRLSNIPVGAASTVVEHPQMTNLTTPIAEDTPVTESSATTQYVKPRGSFAESVAEQTEVTQELLEPAGSRKTDGITRI